MEELKKHKLDLPGPPTKDELPIGPFGVFKEPTFEEIVGIRKDKFSSQEKQMNEIVLLASETAKETVVADDKERDRDCHLSTADSVGFTGTDTTTENNSTLGSCTTLASKSSVFDDDDADDDSIVDVDSSSVDECTRL